MWALSKTIPTSGKGSIWTVLDKVEYINFKKIIFAIRKFLYEIPGDAVEDYCRVSENTSLKSLREFWESAFAIFELNICFTLQKMIWRVMKYALHKWDLQDVSAV